MSLAAHYAAALSRPTRADAARGGVSGDDVPWHEERTPAAVLVAITDRSTPGLILTQRPDHMRKHAGQIAFPGGRVDPEDADVVAAALREAHEEIALDPALVQVFGTSDVYHTGTGYHITPVLATIPADLPLRPNEGEVADVFEVPLDFVLDPANQQHKSGEWQGIIRHYYEIQWQDRRIWGATAGMLVNLARRIA